MLAKGALLFGLLGIAASGCSPARGLDSFWLLRDLATQEERESSPRRVAHSYSEGGRSYHGDVYLFEEGTAASLVLVPGVAPQGKDDPRLVAFAGDLARAEFRVLVPEIANLRQLRVSPDDADVIADAIRHLSEPHRDHGVGLVAISYAAGPALLAALRDDVRRLRFLVLIGGYRDLNAVITFFTTGYYRESPTEPWRYREPNAYGKWVFARSNAGRLADDRESELLTAIADRKLRDPEAEITDLTAGLGRDGRSVLALLTNRDPESVPDLIAALPGPILQDLRALDLSTRDLSRISANVILVHGSDDAIIPVTESRSLANALPEDQVDLFIVSSLAHADLGDITPSDGLTLWRAAYRVLEERDAARSDPTPHPLR